MGGNGPTTRAGLEARACIRIEQHPMLVPADPVAQSIFPCCLLHFIYLVVSDVVLF